MAILEQTAKNTIVTIHLKIPKRIKKETKNGKSTPLQEMQILRTGSAPTAVMQKWVTQ